MCWNVVQTVKPVLKTTCEQRPLLQNLSAKTIKSVFNQTIFSDLYSVNRDNLLTETTFSCSDGWSLQTSLTVFLIINMLSYFATSVSISVVFAIYIMYAYWLYCSKKVFQYTNLWAYDWMIHIIFNTMYSCKIKKIIMLYNCVIHVIIKQN